MVPFLPSRHCLEAFGELGVECVGESGLGLLLRRHVGVRDIQAGMRHPVCNAILYVGRPMREADEDRVQFADLHSPLTGRKDDDGLAVFYPSLRHMVRNWAPVMIVETGAVWDLSHFALSLCSYS